MEPKKNDRKLKMRAGMIGGLFGLIFLISVIFLLLPDRQQQAPRAGVYQDGKLLMVLSLDTEETTAYRIGDEDSYNVIQVSKDGIRVIEASCPDLICTRTVWRGNGSLPVICLPNRLTIMACPSDDEDEEVDVITY